MTALPIVVGFAIGLVTNFIAILMMFRPHERRPWLFFWQQGLVPRERRALAESVGAAVGQELLSPEQIEQLVAGPEGRERTHRLLDQVVAAATANLAQRPLSELLGAVAWHEWAERVTTYLSDPERRKQLHAWLTKVIAEHVLTQAAKSVEEVMGPEAMNQVEELLARRLRVSTLAKKADAFVTKSRYFFTPSLLVSWLYGDENRSAVERAADDLARLLIDSIRERKVDSLLGFEARDQADQVAAEAASRILDHLSSPENARRFVDDLHRQLAPFLAETPLVLSQQVEPELLATSSWTSRAAT